jgi:hypothetical protein
MDVRQIPKKTNASLPRELQPCKFSGLEEQLLQECLQMMPIPVPFQKTVEVATTKSSATITTQ